MPVIDDIETKPRPPKRTWRELPPSPPLGAPLPPPDPSGIATAEATTELPPVDPTVPVAVAAARAPRRRRWVIPAVATVTALSLGAVALRVTRDDASATTPTVAASEKGSPAAVAKALGPAVVQLEIGQGLGSGVIYDAEGLVLTAHHVVASSDEVTVKLADGSTHQGRVVGREPERDLAVVAFEDGKDLTAARLAEPASVEVGEPVVALGSPYGFQASVTSGIVSGLDRELDSPVGTLTGLIQTDTAINPGNSGGPLADAEAVVIGINTAIASSSGGSDGVGFAIPVEEARGLIDTVEQAGGTSAPTVPAPSQSGGLGSLIPGLPQIPGLDQLLPGLEDLLGGGANGLGGLFDELLKSLFGDVFGGGTPAPDQGQGSAPAQPPAQESLGLFTVNDVPSGYSQGRAQIATEEGKDGVEGTHRVVLDGPDGKVTVEAERGPDAADRYKALKGDKADVAGTTGKDLANGGVAWMPDKDLVVVVTPAKGVPESDVDDIANGIEVTK